MPPPGGGSATISVKRNFWQQSTEHVMAAVLGPALSVLITVALLGWLIAQGG